jgi:CRISPR-associated endonuclease Cas2
MTLETGNKHRYEATKGLFDNLLRAGGSINIYMPKPAGALFNLFTDPKQRKFDKRKFRSTVRYMRDKEYIGFKEKGDEITLTLLEKGHEKALKYSVEDMKIEIPAVWDKKWRLVLFDIPEEQRLARNVLKEKLDELGFAVIQKSVYAYPYACHNELDFLRALYNIAPYVKLMVVEKIEDEELLKKRFGL